MWALPTLRQLNERAESKGREDELKKACETGELDGEKLTCEWEGSHLGECEGELRHYLHYDIFSDKPKGILTLCERHDGYTGHPTEGYFECADCQRIHTENISWERYEHVTDDGESICLPCFLERVMDDDARWVPLTDEGIATVTNKSIRKAPHAIGVSMPIPANTIRFVNNVEFDSYSGAGISGGGVEELRETLNELKAEGVTRALIILDAAYQFAVSIAVYAPVKGGKYDVIEVEA